ncbi:hypothetical protein EauM23_00054 [Exiguobacterium phage vB_EauM-23]|nr:hypothetical protein EauM23_00054 [Exiguobacterium phage vB_EauM-23]
MNQLTKVFGKHKVRIVGTEDNPLFVLRDVCDVLFIKHTQPVVQRIGGDVFSKYTIQTASGMQEMTVVDEDGLYDIILDSRKPEAKRFRKWITSEVLPSIRRDGGYIAATSEETPEEIMARALIVAKSTIDRIKAEKERVEAEKQALLHSGKLYTSTELAKELGLRSANELNRLLEEKKVQYKVNGTWVLTARYADKEYTSIKQIVLDNGRTVYDRKWTGAGRDFLINKFGKGGVV